MQYLTPEEVSARYKGKITTKTLANWRSAGKGPAFVKVGGRILYSIAGLLHFEAANDNSPSSANDNKPSQDESVTG